jgi:hypothetical protein
METNETNYFPINWEQVLEALRSDKRSDVYKQWRAATGEFHRVDIKAISERHAREAEEHKQKLQDLDSTTELWYVGKGELFGKRCTKVKDAIKYMTVDFGIGKKRDEWRCLYSSLSTEEPTQEQKTSHKIHQLLNH